MSYGAGTQALPTQPVLLASKGPGGGDFNRCFISGGGGGHWCHLLPFSGDSSSLSNLPQAEKHRRDLYWGHAGRGGGPRTVLTQAKSKVLWLGPHPCRAPARPLVQCRLQLLPLPAPTDTLILTVVQGPHHSCAPAPNSGHGLLPPWRLTDLSCNLPPHSTAKDRSFTILLGAFSLMLGTVEC